MTSTVSARFVAIALMLSGLVALQTGYVTAVSVPCGYGKHWQSSVKAERPALQGWNVLSCGAEISRSVQHTLALFRQKVADMAASSKVFEAFLQMLYTMQKQCKTFDVLIGEQLSEKPWLWSVPIASLLIGLNAKTCTKAVGRTLSFCKEHKDLLFYTLVVMGLYEYFAHEQLHKAYQDLVGLAKRYKPSEHELQQYMVGGSLAAAGLIVALVCRFTVQTCKAAAAHVQAGVQAAQQVKEAMPTVAATAAVLL